MSHTTTMMAPAARSCSRSAALWNGLVWCRSQTIPQTHTLSRFAVRAGNNSAQPETPHRRGSQQPHGRRAGATPVGLEVFVGETLGMSIIVVAGQPGATEKELRKHFRHAKIEDIGRERGCSKGGCMVLLIAAGVAVVWLTFSAKHQDRQPDRTPQGGSSARTAVQPPHPEQSSPAPTVKAQEGSPGRSRRATNAGSRADTGEGAEHPGRASAQGRCGRRPSSRREVVRWRRN